MSKHTQPIHQGKVSQKNLEAFANIVKDHKKTLQRFYEVFAASLKDVRHDFFELKANSNEWKDAWKEVRNAACEVMVDKFHERGRYNTGLSRGTFDGYVCKISRAFRYNVSLDIAEVSNEQELQKARYKAIENDLEMEEAYKQVKKAQVEDKQSEARVKKLVQFLSGKKELTEAVKKAAVNSIPVNCGKIKEGEIGKAWAAVNESPSGNGTGRRTSHTLPPWNDYEEGDIQQVLQGGINNILAWLTSSKAEQYLERKTEESKLLRDILKKIQNFKKKQNKDAKVELSPKSKTA